jgi:Arc/MetJ-type ribon-helix-helix transcriptional regulator
MRMTEQKNEAARRTVSLDPELDAFAQRRMALMGYKKFSHYIQELVRQDTAELRLAALDAERRAVSLNDEPLGNVSAQPHPGAGAQNIVKPYGGGSKTRPINYKTAREARSSK